MVGDILCVVAISAGICLIAYMFEAIIRERKDRKEKKNNP